MSTSALTLRPLTVPDWPAVEASFTHSFTDCRPGSIWDWRFQRQLPTTPEQGYSGMVVTDNGPEVAAFVGASHHRGWLYGQEIPLRRASDHFTHPGWRAQLSGRRGLFLQTEAAYLNDCLASGSLCLGIGLERRVRLGHLGGGLSHPYASGEWWRSRLTPPEQPGRSVLLAATDFADTAIWDALWQERRQTQRAGLIRDGAFLRWRFDDRQGRPYWRFALRHWFSPTPLGYLVLTAAGPRQPHQAMLVDAVLPTDPQLARDAWAQLGLWLKARGIDEVLTYTAPACPEYPLWPALGFLPSATPLPVAGVFLPTPQLPAAAFERDYAFTLADSDLF
jgi:hypothetical protein